MKGQRADKVIAVCVTADTKARFKVVADDYGLSKSGLMRLLIERAIEAVQAPPADSHRRVSESARAERLYVRLYRDDRRLLAERAAALGMPSAKYLAALARSHLRNLAPLAVADRKAIEQCVRELSAIGRNVNQVAHRANQGGVISGITRQDIAVFIKVCTTATERIKAFVAANRASWKVGYEEGNS